MAHTDPKELLQKLQLARRTVHVGGVYRHRRDGTLYRVDGITLREEDLVPAVTYQAVDGPAIPWNRKLPVFLERFERHPQSLATYDASCVEVAPPDARDGTWVTLARWVGDNVPQDALVQLYVELMKDLFPVSQAEDGTPEERLAEAIRDACEVVSYALDEAHLAKFNAAMEEPDIRALRDAVK